MSSRILGCKQEAILAQCPLMACLIGTVSPSLTVIEAVSGRPNYHSTSCLVALRLQAVFAPTSLRSAALKASSLSLVLKAASYTRNPAYHLLMWLPLSVVEPELKEVMVLPPRRMAAQLHQLSLTRMPSAAHPWALLGRTCLQQQPTRCCTE
jgi:hypothetical protein